MQKKKKLYCPSYQHNFPAALESFVPFTCWFIYLYIYISIFLHSPGRRTTSLARPPSAVAEKLANGGSGSTKVPQTWTCCWRRSRHKENKLRKMQLPRTMAEEKKEGGRGSDGGRGEGNLSVGTTALFGSVLKKNKKREREKVAWLLFPGEWAGGGRAINGPTARCEFHPAHWFGKIRSHEEAEGRS